MEILDRDKNKNTGCKCKQDGQDIFATGIINDKGEMFECEVCGGVIWC